MTGLKRKYRQAVRSELTHSCAFLTVTAGDESAGEPPVVVNAYPATSAAAIWDRPRGRIKCGMVVVDSDRKTGKPTWVDVYTETNVIRIRRGARGLWEAAYSEDFEMGRCLMERLAYDADLDRPFGRSRISRSVMSITDNAMRAALRSEVSAEFFTAPQKYLLGADEDVLGGKTKWDAYIGNIFAVSRDENGDMPQFGQLTQGSMQPHIDYMRSLAARFSGETNVPLSELGVVSDNPSSAEAIYAAKEALVVEAQNLNADNGEALAHVALMALAIKEGTTYAEQAARRLRIAQVPQPRHAVGGHAGRRHAQGRPGRAVARRERRAPRGARLLRRPDPAPAQRPRPGADPRPARGGFAAARRGGGSRRRGGGMTAGGGPR